MVEEYEILYTGQRVYYIQPRHQKKTRDSLDKGRNEEGFVSYHRMTIMTDCDQINFRAGYTEIPGMGS